MIKAKLKTLLSKILNVPMVIEEGTSGIWEYRKWSDGVAECWGYTTSKSYAMTRSFGNLYYADIDRVYYPAGLFAEPPVPIGVRGSLGGGTGLVTLIVNGTNKDSFGGYAQSASSLTTAVSFAIHVKGRWKALGGVIRKVLSSTTSLSFKGVMAW